MRFPLIGHPLLALRPLPRLGGQPPARAATEAQPDPRRKSADHWRCVHLAGDRGPIFTRTDKTSRPFWKPEWMLKNG